MNQPLYAKVKDHIREHIAKGVWESGARVPSENELVERFSISRMTANRALRELTAEGLLHRRPGVGTFVKDAKPSASLMELRNIADEIKARGHSHSVRLVTREKMTATDTLTQEFEWERPDHLYYLILVHEENGVPVQIEYRWVNPLLAADFLIQNFLRETPTAYLLNMVAVDELEHTVGAILPDREQQTLLKIGANEPCLVLHRRSWNRGQVVTVATLVYPATRYELQSRFRTNAQGKPL
jgi:GntR family transcriptional regulator, histidine utilization repressor